MSTCIGKAVVGIGIVGMALGVVGCHGGTTTHPPAHPALPTTHATTTPTTTDDDWSTGEPLCSSLVGMPTVDAKDQICETDDGNLFVAGTASENGPKGMVYWNDTGWGVAGGKWQAFNRSDGQLVPPDSYLN